ncbi:hypothetical protein DV965_13685 [Staphylococcus pseudintermedius]|nr:hypothetical protein DV965_13685 [Staphylococcus pseudintermedius]
MDGTWTAPSAVPPAESGCGCAVHARTPRIATCARPGQAGARPLRSCSPGSRGCWAGQHAGTRGKDGTDGIARE